MINWNPFSSSTYLHFRWFTIRTRWKTKTKNSPHTPQWLRTKSETTANVDGLYASPLSIPIMRIDWLLSQRTHQKLDHRRSTHFCESLAEVYLFSVRVSRPGRAKRKVVTNDIEIFIEFDHIQLFFFFSFFLIPLPLSSTCISLNHTLCAVCCSCFYL